MKTKRIIVWIIMVTVGGGCLWMLSRRDRYVERETVIISAKESNERECNRSNEVFHAMSTSNRIVAAKNPSVPLFIQRLRSMSADERRLITRKQLHEWMTEADRERLMIGDVKMFDPARRTGTESRVAEKDQKILRWWQIGQGATDEEAQEVGMICVKYRLTRKEIISLVGYTHVSNETCLGYPYGPGKMLDFEFDKTGALTKVYLPEGAVEVPTTVGKTDAPKQ